MTLNTSNFILSSVFWTFSNTLHSALPSSRSTPLAGYRTPVINRASSIYRTLSTAEYRIPPSSNCRSCASCWCGWSWSCSCPALPRRIARRTRSVCRRTRAVRWETSMADGCLKCRRQPESTLATWFFWDCLVSQLPRVVSCTARPSLLFVLFFWRPWQQK